MRRVLARIWALCTGWCLAAALNAQIGTAQPQPDDERRTPSPVHWYVDPASKPRGPGQRFALLLHALVDSGWHLYALQEPAGGPLPTEIALAQSDLAELRRVEQETPKQAIDPQFHLRTTYFDKSTTFTLRLQTANFAPAAPEVLHILIRYQACNDRICLPVKTDTVEVHMAAGQQ